MFRQIRHLFLVISALLLISAGYAQNVSKLTIVPNSVVGTVTTTGTVTLVSPALLGGQVVLLSSNHAFASVPASVTVPGGQTSANFSIATTDVDFTQNTVITAKVGASEATATIIVNAPKVSGVFVSPTAVYGGQSSTGTVHVDLAAGNNGRVVSLFTDQTFGSVPSTVTIPAGKTSVDFEVKTTFIDKDRIVSVYGSTPGKTISAPLNVKTPDIIGLSVSPNNIPGGNTGTATLTLGHPAGPGGITVTLSTNSPFATAPATTFVPEGSATKTFAVSTALTVTTKTVVLIAGAPYSSTSTTFNVVPLSVFALSFTPSTVYGGTSSTGTVSLNGTTPNPVSVTLMYTGGGISVPATVTIPGGSSSATFLATTSPVGSNTSDLVTATAFGTSKSASLTILAPVLLGFSVNPTTIFGGNSAVGTLTLSGPAPAGGRVVSLLSSSPSVVVPSQVTVPAGATSTNFAIQTSAVPNTTFVSLIATLAGSSKSVTLQLDFNAPKSVGTSPASLEGGQKTTLSVITKAVVGPGGMTINISSSSAAVTVPATLFVPEGKTEVTAVLMTTPVTTQTIVTISAEFGGHTVTTKLTLNATFPTSLVFNPKSVGNGGSAVGTVTLASPAPLGGLKINLSSNKAFVTVPATVMVPAGGTTATFTATAVAGNSGVATITAAADGGSVKTDLPVNADHVTTLTLSPTSVAGGTKSVGTVTISSAAPLGGMVINLTSNQTAATVPLTVTVPAGATSVPFNVTTTPVGTSSTATITATGGGNSATATLSITSPKALRLAVSPSAVTGGSNSTGTVTLSSPAPAGGTIVGLTSDKGFASTPGTVTVAAGATTATFAVTTVPVVTSSLATLTASAGGASATAALTVNRAIVLSMSLNPILVQGGQNSTATVTLTGPAPAGGINVALTSNRVFAMVPGSVLIAAGTSSATFVVTTTSVATTSAASLSATANGATANATLTVTASLTHQLSINPTSVVGGVSSTGTVTLSAAAPAGGVTINLSSNQAFATVPASVTVNAGASSATFQVMTTAVPTDASATISATMSGVTKTATLGVTAPRVLSVGLNPTSVKGGVASTGTVTLTSPAPAGGLTVNLNSDKAFATVSATVVVGGGATTALFTITTTTVAVDGVATIGANVNGGAASAQLTVTANLTHQLSLNPTTVVGGSNSTGTVTLSAAAPAGGVTISLSSNQAFATVPASVTVNAGATSATFQVVTTALPTDASATISATISGVTKTATLSVTAPKVLSLSVNPASVKGGTSSTGTVTLTSPAPAGGLTVTLTSDKAFATVPATMVVAAGASTGTFTVTTSSVPSDGVANLSASDNGGTGNAQLTVTANLGLQLALNPTMVVGGTGSTATVTLSAPAGAGGVVVALSSDKTFATVPGTVTVAAGSTTATFTVSTVAVPFDSSANISATSGGSTASMPLTITAPTLVSVVLSPTSVSGGSNSTATVTISSPAPIGGLTVALSSNQAFATAPATVVIAAGATVGTATITTSAVLTAATATITATLNGASVSAPLQVNPIVGGLANTPWPKFRGDAANTGRAKASSGSGTLLWKLNLSSSTLGRCASPVIGVDGTVYVGSSNNNFYAVNPDGTKKWTFATGAPILSAAAIASDNTVLVSSTDGKLYAINPDGSMKWSYNGGSLQFAEPTVGSDGTIYAGATNGALVAITPAGALKWSYKTGDAIRGCPAIGSDGTIYTGSRDKNLYAINPDGTLKWSKFAGQSFSSPTIGDDGTVFLSTYGAGVFAFGADGTLKWNNLDARFFVASPAVAKDGTCYVGVSSEHGLFAYKPDGTTLFHYGVNGDGSSFLSDVFSSAAIGLDGNLHFGSQFLGTPDKLFSAVYPIGTMRYSILNGFSIDSSPAMNADGVLYFLGSDGNLYAVK